MKLALIGLALTLVAILADGELTDEQIGEKKRRETSIAACVKKNELASLCMKLKIKVIYNNNFKQFVQGNPAKFANGKTIRYVVGDLIGRAEAVLNSGTGLGPKKMTLEVGKVVYETSQGVTWSATGILAYLISQRSCLLQSHLSTDDGDTLYIFFNYEVGRRKNGYTRQSTLCDPNFSVDYRSVVINVDGSGLKANAETVARTIAKSMGVTGPNIWNNDQCKSGYASRSSTANSWSTCAKNDANKIFCLDEYLNYPRCWNHDCDAETTTG